MYTPKLFQDMAQTMLQDPFFSGSVFPWRNGQGHGDGMPQTRGTVTPSMEIRSDDKSYTVTAELPGVAADDIKLEIKDGLLTISGEKQETKESGDTSFHMSERSYGSFGSAKLRCRRRSRNACC